MVESSKILTVSYGTFSCTLEGFDDSFSTMKAIAEYFRDLAAGDRYFGAEPPTPDAEMLTRIAERETSHRVQAHTDETGIVLRAQAFPAVTDAVQAMPPRAEAPESFDAQELSSDTDDHHDSDDDNDSTASATADVDGDAAGPDAGDEQSPLLAVESPAAPEIQPSYETDMLDEMDLDATSHVTFADMQSPRVREVPAHPDADSVAAKLQRIRAVVGGSKTVADGLDDDDSAQTDDAALAARLADEAAEEARLAEEAAAKEALHAEAEAEEERRAEEAEAARLAEEAAEEALRAEAEAEDAHRAEEAEAARLAEEATAEEALRAEAEAEDAQRAEEAEAARLAEEAAAAEEALRAEAEAEEERRVEEAEAERLAEEEAAAEEALRAEAEAEDAHRAEEAEAARLAEEAAENTAEDADDEQAEELPPKPSLRARILRVARRVTSDDAPAADESTDNTDDDAEEAPLKLTSDDSVADADAEAENAFTAVAEETEGFSIAAQDGADDLDEFDGIPTGTLSPDDEADLQEELAEVEREAAADRAAHKGRNALPETDDAAMSRILNQTDQELSEPEGSRRRQAIAQLKAAVVATEAARQLGDNASEKAESESAFRDDLDQVVRPRPAASLSRGESRTERPRPAPLKLVASQRIDNDIAPAAPVQPRRVASSGAPQPDADNFAEFAAEMGATDLSDLLEAAAAYTAYVEGIEDFSRPQIMKKVQMTSETSFSREDGLRTFGTLLREGRISKVSNGRFQVSDQTRFKPEQKAS